MQSVASRRLRKQVAVLVAVYAGVFLGAAYAVDHLRPAGVSVFGFAAVPLLPLVGMFVLFGQWLRAEQDGYKRDLAVRCLLWGMAGAMTTHLFASFLRIFEWRGQLPPFSELWVFAVCAFVAKLSYRAANRVPAEA